MSANRHLCVLCGLVDAGFKEIQTIIYFIKATVDSLAKIFSSLFMAQPPSGWCYYYITLIQGSQRRVGASLLLKE